MNYLIVLFLSAFLLSSCASYKPPKEYQIERERIISKSFDTTWASTVEWFALHNTPIKNIDKSSGFIATDYYLSTKDFPQYCDCGEGGSGIVSKILTHPTGNFNILVKKIDEKST